MEEAILKIIELNYDSETGIISSPKASKEIVEMFERFTDWSIVNVVKLWNSTDYSLCYSEETFKTISDLFTYWNTNFNK